VPAPSFRWNKDLCCVIHDRESGKTTLVAGGGEPPAIEWLTKNVPKTKIIVLNSNFEPRYREIAQKIVKPRFYTTEILDEFIKYLRTHVNVLGIIDDIDLYKPQYSMQLESLAINGRHQNVGLIMLSRRVIGLPKTFCKCVDLLYCGYTKAKSDLDTISEYFDASIAEKVQTLPRKYYFARWSKKDPDNIITVESGKSL